MSRRPPCSSGRAKSALAMPGMLTRMQDSRLIHASSPSPGKAPEQHRPGSERASPPPPARRTPRGHFTAAVAASTVADFEGSRCRLDLQLGQRHLRGWVLPLDHQAALLLLTALHQPRGGLEGVRPNVAAERQGVLAIAQRHAARGAIRLAKDQVAQQRRRMGAAIGGQHQIKRRAGRVHRHAPTPASQRGREILTAPALLQQQAHRVARFQLRERRRLVCRAVVRREHEAIRRDCRVTRSFPHRRDLPLLHHHLHPEGVGAGPTFAVARAI